MGFKYWYEGFIFVMFFGSIITLPCIFVTIFGSKMINELGNFPSKTAQIQLNGWYWIVGAEIVSFGLLGIFYKIFC